MKGGKREGAGRKPLPDKAKKKSVTMWLPPDIIAFLRDSGAIANTTEAIIRASIKFRKWKKEHKEGG